MPRRRAASGAEAKSHTALNGSQMAGGMPTACNRFDSATIAGSVSKLAQDLPNCRLEVWRGPRREELDCYRSQSIAQRDMCRRQLIAVAARTPF